MQEILLQIDEIEKQIELAYQDIRLFALQIGKIIASRGFDQDFVLSPSLLNNVLEAKEELKEIEKIKNNSNKLITTLEEGKTYKKNLKSKLDENDTKIRELTLVLGAIAFEQAKWESSDLEFRRVLEPLVKKTAKLIEKTEYGDIRKKYLAFRRKTFNFNKLYLEIAKTIDNDKDNYLQGERIQVVKEELVKLNKDNDKINSSLEYFEMKIEQKEIEIKNSHSLKEIEDKYNNAVVKLNEETINYGLYLFENASKWINEKTSEEELDILENYLKMNKYLEKKHKQIDTLKEKAEIDNIKELINSNNGKIDKLKNEISLINKQINELDNQNKTLLDKIRGFYE